MLNNFVYFQGYWIFRKLNYGDICKFIRDTCLFTTWDIGNPPMRASWLNIFRIIPEFRILRQTFCDSFSVDRKTIAILKCNIKHALLQV